MNQFIFCIQSDRGQYVGILKAPDGRDAAEQLEAFVKRLQAKEYNIQFYGVKSSTFQAERVQKGLGIVTNSPL